MVGGIIQGKQRCYDKRLKKRWKRWSERKRTRKARIRSNGEWKEEQEVKIGERASREKNKKKEGVKERGKK